jgi:hypothetical protein
MGEQEERRGKLASVGSDNTRQRQGIRQRVLEATRLREDRGRRSPREVAVEWWGRFLATSFWEKGVVIGGAALAGIAAIVAVVVLSGNDPPTSTDEPAPLVALGPSRPRITVQPTPVWTATPRPTARPVATEATPDGVETEPSSTPPPSSNANRQNCQEISGTAYLSSAERAWYLEHCLGANMPGEDVATPVQPGRPGSPPAASPIPAPTSSGLVSASEAITLAVQWLAGQTNNTYAISQQSCNATHMGTRWVVICEANLLGCQGSVCSATLSACVFEQPVHVAPADGC